MHRKRNPLRMKSAANRNSLDACCKVLCSPQITRALYDDVLRVFGDLRGLKQVACIHSHKDCLTYEQGLLRRRCSHKSNTLVHNRITDA
jgi:hypothetical protein